ncbi:glycosyltransferase family 2 protein [Flavobacterium hibisci]|uniref:glycosyltransferase family 2 protein n=1 Tax=Flavobacterium hibisci TaxID=1914462 RepID=UPI001CC0AC03|nr:glycosyltransferase [Flavobacterium hibisci]MBZ4041952.1 glycosyltransferase [Flavobacterium hibisci]
MSNLPLVSICVPTYNGEKYLKETLESIQVQTYTNVEIIISDDGSIDKTLDIVNRFKVLSNFPFYIYHHKPKGIGANWNNCIKKANGEFIKFLFQDDVMESDCIEKMIFVYKENPHIGLLASKRSFIIEQNAVGEYTSNWIKKYKNLQVGISQKNNNVLVLDNLLFKSDHFSKSPLNKIGEPSVVMFKKDIVNKIGYFRTDLKQILDYEFWYRILKENTIIIIDLPLVKFRIHENQATNVNRKQNIDDYNIYDKILYKEYFKLLNNEHQSRLKYKFSFISKITRKLMVLFGSKLKKK